MVHAYRGNASATLRVGGSTVATPSRRRSRRALVVAELAVAFVLLAGAGVLVRSVRHLLDVDPGFRPHGAIAFRVAPPQVSPTAGQSEEAFITALLDDRDRAAAFYTEMLDRLRAAPGVSSVAAVNRLPLTGGWWVVTFEVDGHAPAAAGDKRTAFGRVVTPGYFGAMGMRLRAGREFAALTLAGAQSVVVVDEELARHEFGERSPLAEPLRIDGRARATIVGRRLRHAHGRPRPTRLAHFLRAARPVGVRLLPRLGHGRRRRLDGRPCSARPAAAPVRRELDPTLPSYAVRTLDELVARGLGPRREALRLLGGFSLLALLLAAIGLDGPLAQLARARAREFGVRLALGARAPQIGAPVLAAGTEAGPARRGARPRGCPSDRPRHAQPVARSRARRPRRAWRRPPR